MSPPSLTSSDTSSPSSNATFQDDPHDDADDERSDSEPDSGVLASPVREEGLFDQLYTPDLGEELRRRMGRQDETPVREGYNFQESVARWAERAEAVWRRASRRASRQSLARFRSLKSAVDARVKLIDDNDDEDGVELRSFYQAVIHTMYCLLLEAVVEDQHDRTSECPLTIKPIMSGRYLTGFTPVLSKREGDREIPSYSFVLKTPFPPATSLSCTKT